MKSPRGPPRASRGLSSLLPRHYSLRDIPDVVIRQLTDLLSMDTVEFSSTPDARSPPAAWLTSQRHRANALHASLLRPAGVLARIALSAGGHGIPGFHPCASLCRAHKALDPRVVRDLLDLVRDECTARLSRYRRRGKILDPALQAWLDRLRSTEALWTEEDVFGDTIARCEACTLAAVGARPQTIADLRANLLARRAGHAEPRLLRAVEGWMASYNDNIKQMVRDSSETLRPMITALREEISRDRKRRRAERRARHDSPVSRRRNASRMPGVVCWNGARREEPDWARRRAGGTYESLSASDTTNSMGDGFACRSAVPGPLTMRKSREDSWTSESVHTDEDGGEKEAEAPSSCYSSGAGAGGEPVRRSGLFLHGEALALLEDHGVQRMTSESLLGCGRGMGKG